MRLPRGKKAHEYLVAETIRWWGAGFDAPEISRKTSLSVRTIRQIIARHIRLQDHFSGIASKQRLQQIWSSLLQLHREAWESWEKSKQAATQVMVTKSPEGLITKSRRRSSSYGDPALLKTIADLQARMIAFLATPSAVAAKEGEGRGKPPDQEAVMELAKLLGGQFKQD